MKMETAFLGRKGERCSHQKRIQNPVKHIRWKKFLAKIVNGRKSFTIFAKALSLIFDRVLNTPLIILRTE